MRLKAALPEGLVNATALTAIMCTEVQFEKIVDLLRADAEDDPMFLGRPPDGYTPPSQMWRYQKGYSGNGFVTTFTRGIRLPEAGVNTANRIVEGDRNSGYINLQWTRGIELMHISFWGYAKVAEDNKLIPSEGFSQMKDLMDRMLVLGNIPLLDFMVTLPRLTPGEFTRTKVRIDCNGVWYTPKNDMRFMIVSRAQRLSFQEEPTKLRKLEIDRQKSWALMEDSDIFHTQMTTVSISVKK